MTADVGILDGLDEVLAAELARTDDPTRRPAWCFCDDEAHRPLWAFVPGLGWTCCVCNDV